MLDILKQNNSERVRYYELCNLKMYKNVKNHLTRIRTFFIIKIYLRGGEYEEKINKKFGNHSTCNCCNYRGFGVCFNPKE